MARTKKKRTKEHGRRKLTPMDTSRLYSNYVPSMRRRNVIMAWLTKPGNADRWRRETSEVIGREIITLMETNGTSPQELGDVHREIEVLEREYVKAAELLRIKGQTNAFQLEKAGQDVVAEVLKLCPLYRELVPVFGNSNVKSSAFDNDGATALSTTAIPTTNESNSSALVGSESQGAATDKNLVEIIGVLPTDGRTGGGGKDKEEKPRQENVVVEEEEEGILADVEEDQSDADEGKHSAIDDDESDNDRENDEDQAVEKRNDERSEEEKRDSKKVKTVLNPISKSSNSEESSTEESKSEDEKRTSEDGKEEEEQIQLAQFDEKGENYDDDESEEEEMAPHVGTKEDKRNREDSIQVSEKDNKTFETDEEDKDKVEDMEETEEEEVDEIPVHGDDIRAVGPSSCSSESESDGEDNEEEVPPTQVKVASDRDEETDPNQQEKAIDHSDDDKNMPTAANQREPSRKRGSATDLASSRVKRPRKDSNDRRMLEREAFISRVEQERDHRDVLFELERAKMMCELQTKQVQLAMERSLARKKLLSAGVDPTEVERVLPL